MISIMYLPEGGPERRGNPRVSPWTAVAYGQRSRNRPVASKGAWRYQCPGDRTPCVLERITGPLLYRRDGAGKPTVSGAAGYQRDMPEELGRVCWNCRAAKTPKRAARAGLRQRKK
jgi:hypothetical protein